MTQIQVTASKNYTVTIGSGILSTIGETVRSVTKAEQVCIISDSNVWPLYGPLVSSSLEAVGMQICHFVLPAGEESKNGHQFLALLDHLASQGICRSDCILAIGGGVVGDLAGFTAATYLRGIPYIQIPTTLLAMVDSSVGGKTAIDLPSGKNLCGAFYQPAAVLCDIDTLDTLPRRIFLDGCAEVIKYAILFDADLFAQLEETGPQFDLEKVIAQCIRLKRDVIAQDEFDTGLRQLLNLGHTMGHAIEKCSDFSISHGQAVSIGMAMVCRASHCPDTGRILAVLQHFQLPTNTNISSEALFHAALSDKKRFQDALNMIIPRAIGNCLIQPVPLAQLQAFVKAGLSL